MHSGTVNAPLMALVETDTSPVCGSVLSGTLLHCCTLRPVFLAVQLPLALANAQSKKNPISDIV